jgi:hypothetical protein
LGLSGDVPSRILTILRHRQSQQRKWQKSELQLLAMTKARMLFSVPLLQHNRAVLDRDMSEDSLAYTSVLKRQADQLDSRNATGLSAF